jgi:hypothetical protein
MPVHVYGSARLCSGYHKPSLAELAIEVQRDFAHGRARQGQYQGGRSQQGR